MIYLVGFLGFIGGFVLGQALLLRWLKDRSNRDLLTDKELHMRFGLFNWALAALCCYLAVRLYQLALVAPGH